MEPLKRLHLVIPGELFRELQKEGLLREIDNLTTGLLTGEIKRIRKGREEGKAAEKAENEIGKAKKKEKTKGRTS